VAGGESGGSQFRDIAIGLALGILMDTFLVRTLLVPSTVVLLGRWNWWPSKMSRASAQIPGPSSAAPAATGVSGNGVAANGASGTATPGTETSGGGAESRQPDPLP
jgi:hypothetical protein